MRRMDAKTGAMRKGSARPAGFTLVELMIAFSVLVIALLGVALYFNNAVMLQRFGKEYSIANAAANAVLEYCYAVDFLALPRLHGCALTLSPDASCRSLQATLVGANLGGLGGSDAGEPYTDVNLNSKIDWDDNSGTLGLQRNHIYEVGQTGESFTDSDGDGQWDPPSRCIQIFVTNMECTAFVDTNPATTGAPTVGYKDATEKYVHENEASLPGRCFWNDSNPVYDPTVSASGYLCPRRSSCSSASIDCNRCMRVLIRVRWLGSRGQCTLEVRTIRALS